MKVLIPIDGSEQSLRTIQMAGNLLDKENSDIYLLTVRVPLATEIPWTQIEDNEVLDSFLTQGRQTAQQVGLKVVSTEYVTYPEPAAAICSYADEIQASLIVMGSHGYQGLAKLLIGSVSEQVFKQASQPVIIVRNDKACSIEISHFDKAGLHPVKS